MLICRPLFRAYISRLGREVLVLETEQGHEYVLEDCVPWNVGARTAWRQEEPS
jgi:hypothetical protein